jgi:hypothetical protein
MLDWGLVRVWGDAPAGPSTGAAPYPANTAHGTIPRHARLHGARAIPLPRAEVINRQHLL